MKGRHRAGRPHSIPVARLLMPECPYRDKSLWCTYPAGHTGWHLMARPGSRKTVYYSMETKVWLNGLINSAGS